MKHKHFVWQLESLKSFDTPKLQLEQYSTSAEMAADIIESVQRDENGLDDKVIADFGCGPGILMIAAALMGAKRCIGYEIDEDIVEICKQNIVETEMEKVLSSDFQLPIDQHFNLIIMNPPFGTKGNEGTDLQFVQAAIPVLKKGGSIYSLHKTSTRDGILRKTGQFEGIKASVCAELKWELPKTYKHQRKQTLDIEVDLIRYKKS